MDDIEELAAMTGNEEIQSAVDAAKKDEQFKNIFKGHFLFIQSSKTTTTKKSCFKEAKTFEKFFKN